jgi:hypothetical protein
MTIIAHPIKPAKEKKVKMLNQTRIIYPNMLPDMLQKTRSEFESDIQNA